MSARIRNVMDALTLVASHSYLAPRMKEWGVMMNEYRLGFVSEATATAARDTALRTLELMMPPGSIDTSPALQAPLADEATMETFLEAIDGEYEDIQQRIGTRAVAA